MGNAGKSNDTRIAIIETDIRYMKEKVDIIHETLVGNDLKSGLVADYNKFKGFVTIGAWLIGIFSTLVGIWLVFKG